MTGTSLDGVDVAFIHYHEENGQWKYSVVKAETIPYPPNWKTRIENLVLQNAVTYLKTDAHFGYYLGNLAKAWMEENNFYHEIDFIASHGQTIFHQPENHMTSQIGHGAAVCSASNQPVICDFRTQDVANGGQGAPIVPIGDKILYADFEFCLNLGGIANISAKISHEKIVAFDICGCNSLLNFLAHGLRMEFDRDGEIAARGFINEALLEELNSNWYFKKEYPKSIGGGFISKVMIPVLRNHHLSYEDKMRTACEHIAQRISADIKMIAEREMIELSSGMQMLITGGGAFNKFLVETISHHAPVSVVIPDPVTVKFKEAIVIGLIACLRLRNEVNVLSSVTGALQDTCSGTIHQNKNKPLVIS